MSNDSLHNFYCFGNEELSFLRQIQCDYNSTVLDDAREELDRPESWMSLQDRVPPYAAAQVCYMYWPVEFRYYLIRKWFPSKITKEYDFDKKVLNMCSILQFLQGLMAYNPNEADQLFDPYTPEELRRGYIDINLQPYPHNYWVHKYHNELPVHRNILMLFGMGGLCRQNNYMGVIEKVRSMIFR